MHLFHGALHPQKLYGLLGTGEEWDREWEPWSTSLFTQPLSSSAFVVLYVHKAIWLIRDGGWGVGGGRGRGGMGQVVRAQTHLPVHTASWALLLSGCFTSVTETVWLIGDWGRVGQGARAQVHLPVHTAPELFFFRGALHSPKHADY